MQDRRPNAYFSKVLEIRNLAKSTYKRVDESFIRNDLFHPTFEALSIRKTLCSVYALEKR